MRLRAIVLPLLAVAALTGAALAEEPAAPATPPAPAAQPAPPPTADKGADVEKWTVKHWNKVKSAWTKDKAKWADCRAQAKAQSLKGRKSWSFLYTCMTAKT